MSRREQDRLEEVRRAWRRYVGEAPQLTPAWAAGAVSEVTRTRARDGLSGEFLLGLAASIVVSTVLFAAGGTFYKSHWQSQFDLSMLLRGELHDSPFYWNR
jgi:hypothetical protein